MKAEHLVGTVVTLIKGHNRVEGLLGIWAGIYCVSMDWISIEDKAEKPIIVLFAERNILTVSGDIIKLQ